MACVPCLYRCGFGLKKIGRILGCNHSSLSRKVKKLGLERRNLSQSNRVAALRKVMARTSNWERLRKDKIREYTPSKMATDWKSEWKGVEVESCEHWHRHPTAKAAAAKANYYKNRDRYLLKAKKRWQQKCGDSEFRKKKKKSTQAWRVANKDKLAVSNREYLKRVSPEKRKAWRLKSRNNPKTRMAANIRRRLRDVLKGHGYNSAGTRKLSVVGCSMSELRSHIERQFKRGMTWANYGKAWHIDHIEPIAELVKRGHAYRANHFTNLRPLWAEDNLAKSDAVPHNHQPCLFL